MDDITFKQEDFCSNIKTSRFVISPPGGANVHAMTLAVCRQIHGNFGCLRESTNDHSLVKKRNHISFMLDANMYKTEGKACYSYVYRWFITCL